MDVNEKNGKISVEELLKEGRTVQFSPIGSSMNPLFASKRDYAIVVPMDRCKKLKRGDVALYRRPNGGILVLHRVFKVNKSGYYFVGDHQKEVEGPLTEDSVLGKMVAMVRKGKRFSISNPLYVVYTYVWLFLRPLRNLIYPILDKLNRLLKKKG